MSNFHQPYTSHVLPRQFNTALEYEATHLRDRKYAVRPKGCLGTCGWLGGMAWEVRYVSARSPQAAIDWCERAGYIIVKRR